MDWVTIMVCWENLFVIIITAPARVELSKASAINITKWASRPNVSFPISGMYMNRIPISSAGMLFFLELPPKKSAKKDLKIRSVVINRKKTVNRVGGGLLKIYRGGKIRKKQTT